MKDGFIKVAAVTPSIRVADTDYNGAQIVALAKQACEQKAKIIVFPELCITGYTCHDLFLQNCLLDAAKNQLIHIARQTKQLSALIFVGLPMEKHGKLYNVAACLYQGRILGLIPKTALPTYAEFYEGRHFAVGNEICERILLDGEEVLFGTNLLIETDMQGLTIGCEICEDVWTLQTPGTRHARAGATVLVNLSASNELVGKDSYRQDLMKATSARLIAGYIYANAGEGESTQDVVYSGHNMIAENGVILSESKAFSTGITYAILDISKLCMERRRMSTFPSEASEEYERVSCHLDVEETPLDREFARFPFVPGDMRLREQRCEQILSIQANGLKKRLQHTQSKSAVIGISGGLDSTLALLVTVRAFDLLGLPKSRIIAVTMPCFGTTDRTYENACKLTKACGATLREIDIKEAVTVHFRDIGHDASVHDVTYENGQARERTQVLMNIANQSQGMVIGTGDLSELALGWATYNGDHMSMYGVNAGVPKTLVRHLVSYYADTCQDQTIHDVLYDVLDTPVSPELLPPEDGVISQKTEDLVGPYELHDFFLYYMVRCAYPPKKIYRVAKKTFAGIYDDATILKWLKTFVRRFFAQQFKRSCLPDGPKVGSVAVSPRGDWRMPSDACASIWLKEIEELS